MKVEIRVDSDQFTDYLKLKVELNSEKDIAALTTALMRILSVEESLAHLKPVKKK